MKFIFTLICLMMAIIGYKKDKKIYGPTGFMGLFFGVIMLFSIMKPFEMYETDDFVYELIVIGVIFYLLGSILNNYFPWKIRFFTKRNGNEININRYYFAILIVTVTFMPYVTNSVFYMLQGNSFGDVYYAFAASRYAGDSTLAIPYVFAVVYEFIGKPIAFVLVPVSLTLFVIKERKFYLLMSIYCTFLFLVIGFQRTYVVYLILYAILIFIICADKKLININKGFSYINKMKKKLIPIGIFMIIVFFAVSISRANSQGVSFNIFKTLYYYYCICINLFDKWLNDIGILSLGHTYGFFSFRGFFAPFVSVIQKIGVEVPIMDSVDYILECIATTVMVSDHERANSFVSIFFAFYVDGGIYGIITGMGLIGYLGHQLFSNVIREANVYSISKYIMFYVVILLFSMVNCNFLQISIFWAFIIIGFLFKIDIRGKGNE